MCVIVNHITFLKEISADKIELIYNETKAVSGTFIVTLKDNNAVVISVPYRGETKMTYIVAFLISGSYLL
jgi:hypothetical protein